MSNLKTFRTRLRLTQKELATKLGTTQQTIGRWETGITEIPATQLRELSILLGCSVDELLGMKGQAPKRRKQAFAHVQRGVPWGTLGVVFAFGQRHYPIDEKEYARLTSDLAPGYAHTAINSWIGFEAMDNRLVQINPAFIQRLDFTGDNVEAMPDFVSPEAYRLLTHDVNDQDAGPHLREELERFLRRQEPQAGLPEEEDKWLRAQHQLNSLCILLGNGTATWAHLTDDLATSITILEENPDTESNTFLRLNDDEEHFSLFNLTTVAAIETPLEAYHGFLANDADDLA